MYLLRLFTVLLLWPVVVEVGFDKDEYSVLEGDGQVRVCANLTGFLDRPVVVLFSTQADDAPPPVDGAIINTAAATEGSGQGKSILAVVC